MGRGDRIHKLAEAYLKNETRGRFPEELVKFKKFFTRTRRKWSEDEVHVETTWAFRKDWSLTTFDDWNGCWLRIKVDLCYAEEPATIHVVDFKTGKFSPQWNVDEYMLQLDLYATGALVRFGKDFADFGSEFKVAPRLMYLDHGIEYPEKQKIYTMADLPALKKKWGEMVTPMLNDRTFAPRPNRFCYNCFYRASNKENGGGQCKF